MKRIVLSVCAAVAAAVSAFAGVAAAEGEPASPVSVTVANATGEATLSTDGENWQSSVTVEVQPGECAQVHDKAGFVRLVPAVAGTFYALTNCTGMATDPSAQTTIRQDGVTAVIFTGTTTSTFIPGGFYLVPEMLAVGGGGAGGNTMGGGGGGGGVVFSNEVFAVSESDVFAVTVGAGGTRGGTGQEAGKKGGASSLSLNGAIKMSALGGGGGSGWGAAATSGGSGGGGSNARAGGTGTAGQGFAGATALSESRSGGGGGAGGPGQQADAVTKTAGRGGLGFVSSITGTVKTYGAGGGGGGSSNSFQTYVGGAGGGDGAGNGGTGTAGTAGLTGTGGGGGGGGWTGSNQYGGAGGSGTVVLTLMSTDPGVAVTGEPDSPSADGLPEYGKHNMDNGASRTFVAPAWIILNDARTERAFCLGYRMDTLAPDTAQWVLGNVTNDSTSCTYVQDGASFKRIAWIWKRQVLMAITNVSGSAVLSLDGGTTWFAGTNAWADVGSELVVTARASSGYVAWGAVPASTIFADDRLSVTVEAAQPRSLVVDVFTPTHVWTGAVDADFAKAGNWTDFSGAAVSEAPGDGDSVFIPALESGSSAVTVSAAFTVGAFRAGALNDLKQGTVNVTFENGVSTNVVSGNVHLLRGATLTHTALPSTANEPKDERYRLNLSVGGDMIIEENAFVNVSDKGYRTKRGPGRGENYLGGGAYGGCAYNNPMACYGSIRRPVNCGSGGYSYGGGGAVRLVVAGTLTVDGKILADSSTGNSNGTGSGGSIWLTAGALTGGGYISAMSSSTDWPAGGGRISIVQTKATSLSFGDRICAGSVKKATGPGTLYIENANDAPDCGELIVDGYDKSPDLACQLGPSVEDAGVPFRKITVKNTGRMSILAGVVARTTDLEVSSGCTLNGSGMLELMPAAGQIAHVDGPLTLGGLICTNAGARVEFAAGKTVAISAGGLLQLVGTKENPIELLAADGAEWFLNFDESATSDIMYVSVSNSNAKAGSTVLAISSNDLGGNEKWSFQDPILPDAVIEWTGVEDADWSNGKNWAPSRVPVETDDVRILNSHAAHFPVLSKVEVSLNKLTMGEGTTLTLSGSTIDVTNELTVAGTFVFTGRQTLALSGPTVNFAGATVVPAESTVRLMDGVEAFISGGCSFYRVEIERTGGTLLLADGVRARSIGVRTEDEAEIVVAAGKTIEASSAVCSCSAAGSGKYLTLKSSAAGTAWYLNTPMNAYMVGVKVSDSTATDAAAIASLSMDNDRNVNWTFGADIREWIGGTADFNAPANWSPAGVPTNTTDVLILPGVKNPELTKATSIRSLTVGGDGRAVQFTVGAELSVSDFAYVGAGATVFINKPLSVSNDFVLATGATLTHTALPSTANEPKDECYRLNLSVGGNMTIEENAFVNVSDKGYRTRMGPGGSGNYLGGGAYGGCAQNNSMACYGSIRRPVNCGSGGYSYGGGGAVRLVVAGTLTVDGQILAESSTGNSNGTGSGGSIWLTVGALVGGGYISAMSASTTYPAGGGRISVVQTNATALAFDGDRICAGSVKKATGPGTLYVENANDAPDCGELIVDGYGKSPTYACQLGPSVEDAGVPFRKITVKNTGRMSILAGVVARTTDLEVPSGCTLNGSGMLDLFATIGQVAHVDAAFTLNGLICTNGADAVEFAAGKTVTVADNGFFWLDGDKSMGGRMKLQSSEPGTQWKIIVGTNLTGRVRNLDVRDSNAKDGQVIKTKRSVGKWANNDNWEFPAGMALIVR